MKILSTVSETETKNARRRRGTARLLEARASLPEVEPSWKELYRRIFVSLHVSAKQGAVIGITSSVRGEGRTSVAIGLASTLAGDLDSEVLLVDADLERPSLARLLNLKERRGMPEVLPGQASIVDGRQRVGKRLFAVTGGADQISSAPLLRSMGDDDPFEVLHGSEVISIVDLPPVLNTGYAPVAASVADAVVMVIRAGITPAPLVREAIDRLGDHRPQGAVLVGEKRSRRPSKFLRHSESS